MKKNIWVLILKTVAYAITLALGFLGVSSLASCSVSKSVDAVGKATIISTDTTYISHKGALMFKK